MMNNSLQTTFADTLIQAARKFSLIGHHFQEISDLLSSLSANVGSNEPLIHIDKLVGDSMQNAIGAFQAMGDQVAHETLAVPLQMETSQVSEEKENLPGLVNTASKAPKKPRKKVPAKPLSEPNPSIVEHEIKAQPQAPTIAAATVEAFSPAEPSQLQHPVPESQHNAPTPVDPLSASAPANGKKKVINVFNYYCNEFKPLVKSENPMLSKIDVYKKLVEQWKQYPDKAAYTKKVMESHQETPTVDDLSKESAMESAKTMTKKKRSRKHSTHADMVQLASSEPVDTSDVISMQKTSTPVPVPVSVPVSVSVPVHTPIPTPVQLAMPMTLEKMTKPVSSNGLAEPASMVSTPSSIMGPILTESDPSSNIVTVTEKAKKPSSKKRKKSHNASTGSSMAAAPIMANSVAMPIMSQSQPVASVHHHTVMPVSPVMSQSQPIAKVDNKPNPSSKMFTPPTTATPSPAPQKIMTPAMREIQEEAALSSLEREREREKEKKKKKDSNAHHLNMNKH